MKRCNFILCLLLSIVLSSCSNRYYAVMLQPDVRYAPCFGHDSIPSYMTKNEKQDEVDRGLARVNMILVNDMYPFLFKQTVQEDANKPEAAFRCYSSPKIEDNEVRAYINLISQPPKKEPEKSKESSPASTAQKETTKTEKCCNSGTNTTKDQMDLEYIDGKCKNFVKKGSTKEGICSEKITITTKLTEPVEKKTPNMEQDALLTQDINLVTSNYLYSLNRADRLEKAYTLVIPLHAGVEFVKIDSPMADKTVTFGTESVKSGLSTTSGIPVGSSLGSTVSISPSIEKSIQRNILKHYVLRNAEIFPMRNVLMISQDGGPADADIAGSAEVAATIKIPTDLCRYITVYKIDEPPAKGDAAGKPNSALSTPELYLNSSTICYIERVSALVASVSVARIVTEGKETVKEDDDIVIPRTFRNASVIDLWKNPMSLYQVEILQDKNISRILLDNSQSGTRGSVLTFRSFQDAVTVRNLIAAKSNFLLNGLPVQVGKVNAKILSDKRDVSTRPQSLDVVICTAGVTATFGRNDKCTE